MSGWPRRFGWETDMLELAIVGVVCIAAIFAILRMSLTTVKNVLAQADQRSEETNGAAIEFSRELMRMVAQTDERTKAFMRNSDKVLDRWMAMSAPTNYANMRQNSGIIEGAQHGTKQHFVDPSEPNEAPLTQAELADQATLRMNRVKSGLDAAIQERGKVVPVATALDFDRMQNGGP